MKWTFWLAVLLLAGVGAQAAGNLSIKEDTNFITVYEGKQPVLRYVVGDMLKEGVNPNRTRSTYIHPLYSLDGKVLTDDFPADLPHQRGLSWMWAKVTFDGITKDLWNLKGIRQKHISHKTEVNEAKGSDPGNVKLTFNNGWHEDSTGRKIIDESVTFVVLPSNEDGRFIDVSITLNAVDTPVALGVSKAGYSGLAVRFAPREDALIVTPKGSIKKDEARKRYSWADFSARFDGSKEYDGVAVFENKTNLHYPAGWLLRYYGMISPAFAANSADWVIEMGKPLTLNHRVYIHRGKADPEKLEAMFREYNVGRAASQ